MTRTILVGEVRTGRRIATIPVSDGSWSLAHRGVGSVDATIPLDAAEFKAREQERIGLYPSVNIWPSPNTWPRVEMTAWRIGQGIRREFLTMIEPGRCFMAMVDGDAILEAGPIWAHDVSETNVIKVGASGMGSILNRRRVMAAIDSGWAAWQVIYEGMSLGTIAKRLIQLSMTHTGGNLPIVLPDDILAANDEDHRRTYKGSELGTVWDRLVQLSSVINGPDIEFAPRFTSDRLGVEWVMRVGAPMLSQAGTDHVWDLRVPRSSVKGLTVSRDASAQASRSWATGNDSASGLLMARKDSASLVAAGFPLLETAESRSTVESQGTLDSWAAGNLAASERPMLTISMSVNSDTTKIRPGDFATIYPPHDHYLDLLRPDQPYRCRVASMSGGLDNWTALKMIPQMETR